MAFKRSDRILLNLSCLWVGMGDINYVQCDKTLVEVQVGGVGGNPFMKTYFFGWLKTATPTEKLVANLFGTMLIVLFFHRQEMTYLSRGHWIGSFCGRFKLHR